MAGTIMEFMFGRALWMSNEGKETIMNTYFRELLTAYYSFKPLNKLKLWDNPIYNICVMPGNPTTNPSHKTYPTHSF
jgi:hypothetical protein